MLDTLFTTDRFLTYVDYITIIAQSGLKIAQSLSANIDIAKSVDIRTFTLVSNGSKSKANLVASLTLLQQQISNSASSVLPMSDVFKALYSHIKRFTGLSIDEYLTTNNLKVTSTFADLSRIYGEIISNSNIEESI